jgi:hypothetical protein
MERVNRKKFDNSIATWTSLRSLNKAEDSRGYRAQVEGNWRTMSFCKFLGFLCDVALALGSYEQSGYMFMYLRPRFYKCLNLFPAI